jgi:hypothetical protein
MNANVWWIAQMEALERFENAERKAEQNRLARRLQNSQGRRAHGGLLNAASERLRKLECQVREALYVIESRLAIPWARQEVPGHSHGCD